MGFSSWRGTVGVIKPTRRPGSLEEFIRLMPEGIGVLPLLLNVREGTAAEFKGALAAAEEKIAELAECEVDLIHPQGAPPFMFQGYEGERTLVKSLEEKYGVPIVTSGMVQVEGMRALRMRRIMTMTRSGADSEVNRAVKSYLEGAGFEVASIEGLDLPFQQLGQLSEHVFYSHAKAAYLRNPDIDGIHILGSGWRLLGILETLEQDLNLPVAHPVAARVWAIQRRLHVRQPVDGYGRLLAEMPL